MSKIKRITIPWVHFVAYRLAAELMQYNEPIPDFSTRFPNILESCVETPFQTYAKKPLYKGLLGKATALFYFMIKNHPFQNGNKRIAVTALIAFLFENNKWMKEVTNDELYSFAVYVAESKSEDKGVVMDEIYEFLSTKTRRILI